METNELPEALKKLKADFFRLAIDQKWSLENLWDMVEEQLKAKDEENERLREKYEYIYNILAAINNYPLPHHPEAMKQEIDSVLLSPETKPE